MGYSFSQRSLTNLAGVHHDLVRVVHAALAISPIDFGIIEGVRTLERQKELFNAVPPKSWTMNSRHLHGMAVDFDAFVGGTLTWEVKYYGLVAAAMKRAALDLGVPVKWGGEWAAPKTDSDHLELDHVAYPDEALVA